MPLPAYLARAFQRINPESTQESDYYGAYNMLLVHAFPGQEGYVVHPQFPPKRERREPVDFVIYFIIYADNIPVFFVEVKTGGAIRELWARAAADEQMRFRIEELFEQFPSKIHGILTPQPIPCHPNIITNTAPADRWDTDIMTDEGFHHFMDIVKHVKTLSVIEGDEA